MSKLKCTFGSLEYFRTDLLRRLLVNILYFQFFPLFVNTPCTEWGSLHSTVERMTLFYEAKINKNLS
jgi:hypothetical protein